MEETSHPVVAAVAFLATLIFGTPNQDTAMSSVPPAPLPSLISVNPDPPQAGQEAKFCFDFRPGDPSPVTLQITWTLAEGESGDTIQLSRESPCKKVSVPADAESVNVTDQSGTSADYGAIVL